MFPNSDMLGLRGDVLILEHSFVFVNANILRNLVYNIGCTINRTHGGKFMLYSLIGSIFDSTAGVLVNPVNTKGVSGAGLALEFKKRFPRCTKRYEELCATG